MSPFLGRLSRAPAFSGSVRARLLRLALLLLLPGLAISAVLTWRSFLIERDGAAVALQETAHGLTLVLDREFARARVLLRTLAATDEVRQADHAAFDRLARATVVMDGSVVLLDRAGQELVDTALPPGAALPRLPPPADWVNSAQNKADGDKAGGEIRILPLAADPGKKSFSLQVVLPVMAEGPGAAADPAQRHLYDLRLVVPAGAIQRILLRENLPPGWVAAIIDPQGRIVARTVNPEQHVGRIVPLALEKLRAGVASAVWYDTTSLDGTAVLAVFARSAKSGWAAGVNAPQALVVAQGLQSTWLLVWMGSLAISVGLLGALHVAGGIAGRIEAMARAARALGESDGWTPIPSGLDEADAVAQAMQVAAAALAERRDAILDLNASLAERVEARTAELAEANRAVGDQRRLLGLILDHMPIGVVVHGVDGGLVFANLEARRLAGWPLQGEIPPTLRLDVRRGGVALTSEEYPSARARAGQVTERALITLVRPDAGPIELEVNASPLRDADDRITLSVTTLQDITARLEAEEARRRSQRLEAVGQLTGGLAHEFNNLLMAISGCLDLLASRPLDARATRLVENAARATDRGGRLTRQLLAFARRQHLQPEPVDLNALVAGMQELLESTLGRGIRVEAALSAGTWPAMADTSQLELVLLNLAINARDAMTGGGQLTIGTGNIAVGPPRRAEEPPAGDYAVLSVTDTGEGMPPHVLARAFEPFFTTKEVGLGSGLGLPQVLGVAQQLGGGVSLESAPGQGTTVRVYLPRALAAPGQSPAAARPAAAPPLLRHVRLLLVDDDRDVRDITRDMLAEMGAVVTEAEGPAAALLLLRTGLQVDLVLADLTMPQSTGIELAAEIARFLPDMPIVLMTGYGPASMRAPGPHIRATLQKPFRAEALARLVAAQLGRPAPQEAEA